MNSVGRPYEVLEENMKTGWIFYVWVNRVYKLFDLFITEPFKGQNNVAQFFMMASSYRGLSIRLKLKVNPVLDHRLSCFG